MSIKKKVWVNSLFGVFKGIVIDDKHVQLVGYPFGSYPNGKVIEVSADRISERNKS